MFYFLNMQDCFYRVSAKTLIVKDWKVLMCRWDGRFWFPGGWIDHWEDIIEALAREVYEELGVKDIEIKTAPMYVCLFFRN